MTPILSSHSSYSAGVSLEPDVSPNVSALDTEEFTHKIEEAIKINLLQEIMLTSPPPIFESDDDE